ncbi:hypothetical protein [Flagellimonas lutaonensis]|uniref:Uncharacterized protein n=1 Tax=Flagellimonas lutaonensis TaxID=516051 RepID=A0A0D5YUW3_9FLAO|nr:hypothetical protein [Allomuricauda lutaonensis]AKA35689.1 hypothetical protein VC82_2094 [Allomuricauda lutaonensis]
MKKVLYIIAGLILISDLIYGFVTDQKTGGFFGFELNIWIHRLIQLALIFLIGWSYYRQVRAKN